MPCRSLHLILVVSIAALISGDVAAIREREREPVAGAAAPPGDGRAGFSLPVVHWRTMAEVVEEEIQLAANATASATEQKFVVPFRHRRRYSLYLVQLRIGGGAAGRVPSRYVLFDTGSDLSWTQCVPCQRCNRGYYLPLNAIKSGTYRHLSCEDPLCEHGTGTQCSMNYVSPGATDDLCLFRRSYGDGSKVSGYVGSDIFRFGNSIAGGGDGYSFEQPVAFGCAMYESTSAVREYSTGILGLGIGPLSFVAQAGVNKFSYCALSPERNDLRDEWRKTTSYLRFGDHAVTSGMRIPFKQDGYRYAISLKSVTYRRGGRIDQQQPVPIFLREEEAEQLPMLVDSGSALIWLPSVIFDPLLKRIDDEIALVRVSDPTSNPNINCYFGDMSDVEAVSVTLGFNGGAELELFGDTLFTEGSAGSYVCLGVAGGEQAALGMIAQRNTNVGYDLSNRDYF
ncbi:aspartic proteinase CDR1-like [Aegilops tauschii subsp. strangulata]|uniref:aspartic proteinase CDR1-like n=1 Tax=Aegilops tauschii subsp. strangulata TaxID=200361 RepID=UPI00098AAB96